MITVNDCVVKYLESNFRFRFFLGFLRRKVLEGPRNGDVVFTENTKRFVIFFLFITNLAIFVLRFFKERGESLFRCLIKLKLINSPANILRIFVQITFVGKSFYSFYFGEVSNLHKILFLSHSQMIYISHCKCIKGTSDDSLTT